MSVPRIAVVGGGVGACSLAYGLREQIRVKDISVHLFEMGRGTGGRAATRGTRERPNLRVDHGVPAFSAHTPNFQALCDSFVRAGSLQRCSQHQPPLVFGTLKADGSFQAEAAELVPRYVAAPGLGMSSVSEALLRGGDLGADPLAQTTFGTMVDKVEADDGGWRLRSRKGDDLGTFDWLVVTSTGFAHPRWRAAFGGEPPLVEAAAALGDAALDNALAHLAPLASKPVIACMLAYEAEAAAAWANLPFFKASVESNSTLSRMVVQRLEPSLTVVVLHSTHEFALSSAHVYGKTSTAARLAGAASDADEEQQVLEAMIAAAELQLAGLIDASHVRSPAWGPFLHRWGSAFPDAPLLAEAHAMIPSAKVVFAGDFIDAGDGRAGSVEGAVLSGLRAGEALASLLRVERSPL